MGLVVTRREGASVVIGECRIDIIKIGQRRVRLNIEAPPEMRIDRPESEYASEPDRLADRLVRGIQQIEKALGPNDTGYATILEHARAMIRREETNT